MDNQDKTINRLRTDLSTLQRDMTKASEIIKDIRQAGDTLDEVVAKTATLINKNNDVYQTISTNNIEKTKEKQRLLNYELNQSKAINKVLEEQYKEKQKLANAQEKINLTVLKQYTQEQANRNNGMLNKTLSRSMSETASINSIQTLSSGNTKDSASNDNKDSAISSMTSLINLINEASRITSQYKTGINDLSRTLNNATNQDLKEYGQQALQFSKDFGVPFEEVQSTMTKLARSGVGNKADLLSMTKTVLTGINTTEIKNASDMTGYLVDIVKQLGLSFGDSEKIIDSWTKLGDKYAVQSNDFAEAIRKSGSASKALGLDINDLNAMVVVLGESTHKSGSEIGDAIKTMETRLLIPKTIDTLNSLGISVMKDTEHFNSFQDIILQVNQRLNEFGKGSVNANTLMGVFGGAWGKNDIQVLANDLERISTISKESLDSSGYSIKQYEKTMSTLEKQTKSLKASFDELFVNLGNSGALDSLNATTSAADGLETVFSKMPQPIKEWAELLDDVATAYENINSMTKLISGKDIKELIDPMLSSMPIFNKYFGKGTTQKKAFDAATQSLAEQISKGNIKPKESAAILEDVGQQLGMPKSSIDKLAAARAVLDKQLASGGLTKNKYTSELKKLTSQTKAAESGTKTYAASIGALEASQISANESTLALSAAGMGLQLAFSLVIMAISWGITEIIQWGDSQKHLAEDIKNSVDTIENQAKSTHELINEYQSLASNSNRTSEEQTRFKEVQESLIKTVPGASKIINNQTMALKDQVKTLYDATDALERKNLKEQASKNDELYNNSQTTIQKENKNITKFNKSIKDTTTNISRLESDKNLDSDGKAELDGLKEYLKLLNDDLDNSKDKILQANVELQSSIILKERLLELDLKSLNIDEQGINTINSQVSKMSEEGKSIDEINDFIDKTKRNISDLSKTDIYQSFEASMNSFNSKSTHTIEEIATQKETLNKLGDSASNLDWPKDKLDLFNDILNSSTKSLDENIKSINEAGSSLLKFGEAQGEASSLLSDLFGLTSHNSEEMDTSKEKIQNKVQNLNSEIKELNQAIFDSSNGQTMTADQVGDLILKYPELASAVDQASEGYTIQKSALEAVRQTHIKTMKDTLNSQKGIAVATFESAKAQLQAYGIVITALASYKDAHDAVAKMPVAEINSMPYGSSTPTQAWLAQFDNEKTKQDKLKNQILAYGQLLDQIKALGNSLESPSYGVSNYYADSYKSAADSVKEYASALADAKEKANSNLLSLQSKLVEALKEKYNEDKDNELKALKSKKETEINSYTDQIKKLQNEIDDLEDTKDDNEKKLTALKKEMENWSKDDSQYSKGKQKDLQQQIDDLTKQMTIDDLNHQKSILEEQKQTAEDSYSDQEEDINDHYDSLLRDANIYAEANKEILTKNQNEILDLLTKYAPEYSSIGQILGQSLSSTMLSEVETGLSALSQIQTGNYDTNSSSGGGSGNSSIAWDGKQHKTGEKSAAVKRIQENLNANGYNLVVDGSFGSKTASAIKDFQKNNGLKVDGIVGSHTWEKLIKFHSGGMPIEFSNGSTEGLAIVKKGELTLNPEDTRNLLDTVTFAKDLMVSSLKQKLKTIDANLQIPYLQMPSLQIPKFVMPNFAQPDFAQRSPSLPEGFIKQYNTINNNSDFAMENGMDNYNRNMENILKRAGYNIGIR